MYKIKGADGKEYGPVSPDQLRQWAQEGRITRQTPVLAPGSATWQAAAEVPELASIFAPSLPPLAPAMPPTFGASGVGSPRQGLAITSFVLGVLSPICLGFLTGIPAIICGHLARARAKRTPAEYGGSGFALAGLLLGYVGVFLSLAVLPAMLLPALAKGKQRAESINCVNNMKQIGLAFKVWAIDNNGQFPFNVSTNAGGTLELARPGPDNVDPNGAIHLMILSNELSTPKILVCPSDKTKTAAPNFIFLNPANVSYQIHTGPSVNDTNAMETLATCPIHGHVLHCDGSVEQKRRGRRY